MTDFFIFRRFDTPSQAKEFECFLRFHNVDCKIEQDVSHEVLLIIRKTDEDKTKSLLDDPQSGYNLLVMSPEDLLSWIQQAHEGHNKTHQLALDLLKIHVKTIHTVKRNELEEARLMEESKPAYLSVFMYWFIFVSTLFGGIGVMLAIHVITSKLKLSNGQRIHLYVKEDRDMMKWALSVFSLFVIAFIVYLLFSLNRKIN
ncbi:MAG: hypothetical protein K0R51_3 [Cytophagaceae bacterium]|jgi:hypothetical protein|nr:hypothetical protein [Cytophagaceae bacterium]